MATAITQWKCDVCFSDLFRLWKHGLTFCHRKPRLKYIFYNEKQYYGGDNYDTT